MANRNKELSEQPSNRSIDRTDLNKSSKKDLQFSHDLGGVSRTIAGIDGASTKRENTQLDMSNNVLDNSQDKFLLDISRDEIKRSEHELLAKTQKPTKNLKAAYHSNINSRIPTPKRNQASRVERHVTEFYVGSTSVSKELRADIARSVDHRGLKTEKLRASPFMNPVQLQSKHKTKKSNGRLPPMKNTHEQENNEKILEKAARSNSHNNLNLASPDVNIQTSRNKVPDVIENVDSSNRTQKIGSDGSEHHHTKELNENEHAHSSDEHTQVVENKIADQVNQQSKSEEESQHPGQTKDEVL